MVFRNNFSIYLNLCLCFNFEKENLWWVVILYTFRIHVSSTHSHFADSESNKFLSYISSVSMDILDHRNFAFFYNSRIKFNIFICLRRCNIISVFHCESFKSFANFYLFFKMRWDNTLHIFKFSTFVIM